MEGKLVFKDKITDEVIHIDFDTPQNLTQDSEKWLQEASQKMEEKGTKGSFTEYCGGKVTQACIDKAKKSGDKGLVKKAVFAENVRGIAKKKGDLIDYTEIINYIESKNAIDNFAKSGLEIEDFLELDFFKKDFEENKNLTKNNEKNIKNKMENDTKMDIDEKEKPETKQDKDMDEKKEEQPEEKKDMKTTKQGMAPEYESEERKKLLEEDENEMNPKKKKADMALADVISSNNDLRTENEALKAQIKDMLPIVNRMKEEYKTKDVKDFNDLQETLSREPYNVPKETMKEKDLLWLKDKKDFLDSLPFVKDFIEKQPISHEDVPRFMDFETGDMDPVAEVFNHAQGKYKIAMDFGGGEDK